MKREEALEVIIDSMRDFPIVASTGKISREIFEIRERMNLVQKDFLVLGSLGLASSIAMGVAIGARKRVVAIDGDGAALMHLGSIATIGHFYGNVVHILIDNQGHDSTGGQPAAIPNWMQLFKACNYDYCMTISWLGGLKAQMNYYLHEGENLLTPTALIVKVEKGSREDLGRPTLSPIEIKNNFMENLR